MSGCSISSFSRDSRLGENNGLDVSTLCQRTRTRVEKSIRRASASASASATITRRCRMWLHLNARRLLLVHARLLRIPLLRKLLRLGSPGRQTLHTPATQQTLHTPALFLSPGRQLPQPADPTATKMRQSINYHQDCSPCQRSSAARIVLAVGLSTRPVCSSPTHRCCGG